MAYAFVQQAENSTGNVGATTLATSATISTTAANMLWWMVTYVSSTGAKTVTMADTALNTYTEVGNFYDATSDVGMRWGYAKNITASAVNLTTATFSNTVTYRGIYVAEYSGLSTTAPFDQTVGANNQATPGTSADGVTSGNLTPTGNPSVLIGFSQDQNDNNKPNAGTGFTSRTEVWAFGGAGTAARPEDKRLTTNDAVAATFTATVNERHMTAACNFFETVVASNPARNLLMIGVG